jgi:hypothetical protein
MDFESAFWTDIVISVAASQPYLFQGGRFIYSFFVWQLIWILVFYVGALLFLFLEGFAVEFVRFFRVWELFTRLCTSKETGAQKTPRLLVSKRCNSLI